jgi:Flp pilus assembly protein TadB
VRGRRLRARRAERRLAELEEALERLESGAPPQRQPWYARPGMGAATATAFFASAAALVAVVGLRGPDGVLVGVLDVAMLLATALWFSAAVGSRTRARGKSPYPPNGGSRSEGGGR